MSFSKHSMVANGTSFFCAKQGDKNKKGLGRQNVAFYKGVQVDSLRNTELACSSTRDGKERSFRRKTSPKRMITTTIKCDHHKIDLTSVYFPHSGFADMHIEKMCKKHRITLQEKHIRIIAGDFNAQLGPGIDLEKDYVGEHTTGQPNKKRSG